MIDYDDALSCMSDYMPLLADESCSLEECHHRILAQDVMAHWHHPPRSVSAMDGYAVAFEQTVPLLPSVVGDIAAAAIWKGVLQKGECVRIYTGGVIPDGADCVVPFEASHWQGEQLCLDPEPSYWRKGCFIRPQALDFKKGETILKKGKRLNGRDIALAAAGGHSVLPLVRKPVIACLATGNELMLPEEARHVHSQEPDKPIVTASSLYGLMSFIESHGGKALNYGIAKDDDDALLKSLHDMASSEASILVTTGGVSKGAHDRMAFLGGSSQIGSLFDSVAVRPGKPFHFMIFENKPLLAFPGNPVSTMVGAQIFLAPMMHLMMGIKSLQWDRALLGRALPRNGGRLAFLRSRLCKDKEGRRWVFPYSSQDSCMLRLLSWSDVLVRQEKDAPPMRRGVLIPFSCLN